MWNLNNINEQRKLKQTHRHREQTGGCQRERGLGDWGGKVKRLRSTDWYLQNSHGEVSKLTIGNTVNDIAVSMNDASWGTRNTSRTLSKVHDRLTTKLYTWNQHKIKLKYIYIYIYSNRVIKIYPMFATGKKSVFPLICLCITAESSKASHPMPVNYSATTKKRLFLVQSLPAS